MDCLDLLPWSPYLPVFFAGIDKRRAAVGRGADAGHVLGGAAGRGVGGGAVAAHGPLPARRIPRGPLRYGRRSRLPYETTAHYAQVHKELLLN